MRRHAKIENMASMSIEELEIYAERCSFINLPYVGDEITKRRAARDAILDLAEQLDAEGMVVVPKCAPVAVEEGYGDISNAQVIAGTAYQVVGMLSSLANNFEHPEVQRALDWFSDYDDEKGVTEELLPWGADLFAAAPLPAAPSSVEG